MNTIDKHIMNFLDFLSGSVSGWAIVAVGQPLDYIKVKVQTARKGPISLLEIVSSIYR